MNENNVHRLPNAETPPPPPGVITFADYGIWVTSRVLFGPPLVMWIAGMLHHDIHPAIPAIGFDQSGLVVMALLLVAFIIHR